MCTWIGFVGHNHFLRKERERGCSRIGGEKNARIGHTRIGILYSPIWIQMTICIGVKPGLEAHLVDFLVPESMLAYKGY